ncbi:MAG: prealbumin-like fold domain-containing protein, partial [Enterococcus sp.]
KDKDEQTPLTGAEFSLEDSQGKKLNLVKKDATFTAENLTAGSYTLTETQVPQFFERLFNHVKILIDEQGNVKIAADTKEGVEAIKITKTNGEEDNLIEFSVLNSKKILGVLPTTGGIGTQIFIISALLLLLAASMLAGVYWYRNKKIS